MLQFCETTDAQTFMQLGLRSEQTSDYYAIGQKDQLWNN